MSNVEDVAMEEEVYLPPDWEHLTLEGLRQPAGEATTRDDSSTVQEREEDSRDGLVIAEESNDGEVCFMTIMYYFSHVTTMFPVRSQTSLCRTYDGLGVVMANFLT